MNNDTRTPISVVVITKNEEGRIKDCLESVKWAEEIVVLDDDSTDKTREIASQYTDKIYQKEMTNEGAHRNYAYSLASNEWVLSLDADERATPELEKEIQDVLRGGTECNGFTIPRKNYIGDYWIRHGGWYPSGQLKLFRRDEFKYEEVNVHPRAFMEYPKGDLVNPIIHYSYRDIEDFVTKMNNQTSRESEKWLALEKGMPYSRAVRRMVDRFFRAYNKKNGKKDGMLGFILAILGGGYQYLSYAKYWEEKLGLVDRHIIQKSEATAAGHDNDPDRWKLSVVILTKNEEAKIENCLKSLRWVDEVVVVDGLSTDRTVEICEKYGAKVVPHKFEGDFGQERNIGVENSTGDWVLQLDADEAVTEGFRKGMLKILKEKNEKYVAYKFMRKNYFLGHFMRYGGWYHHSHHLFRKGFAHYDGRVHHQLIINGEEGLLKADIEHNPFQSIEQLVRRQNRYTTIEAKELLEENGDMGDEKIRFNIRKKPFKLFWKFYVKKQGFREGKHGFIFSVFFAAVHFMKWVKYWELVRNYGDE